MTLLVIRLGAGLEGNAAIGRSWNSPSINKKEGLMKNQKKVLATIIAALGCSFVGSASAGDSVTLMGRAATVDPAAEICFVRLNEWISKPSNAPASCTSGIYQNTMVSVALPNDPTDNAAYGVAVRVHANNNTYCRLVEVNPTNGAFFAHPNAWATGASFSDQGLTLKSGFNFSASNVYAVECRLGAGSFLRSVTVN